MVDGDDKNASDSSDGRGDSGCLEAEYLEVQMDLTDDLLHMVYSAETFFAEILIITAFDCLNNLLFSFLFSRFSLSRTTLIFAELLVCRSWRVASAHEDFWRCFNFENRNISIEKSEFK